MREDDMDYSPNKKSRKSELFTPPQQIVATMPQINPNLKRRHKCGQCEGCLNTDCLRCVYCKDMKKYGGKGMLKQKCIHRRCKFLTKAVTPKTTNPSAKPKVTVSTSYIDNNMTFVDNTMPFGMGLGEYDASTLMSLAEQNAAYMQRLGMEAYKAATLEQSTKSKSGDNGENDGEAIDDLIARINSDKTESKEDDEVSNDVKNEEEPEAILPDNSENSPDYKFIECIRDVYLRQKTSELIKN